MTVLAGERLRTRVEGNRGLAEEVVDVDRHLQRSPDVGRQLQRVLADLGARRRERVRVLERKILAAEEQPAAEVDRRDRGVDPAIVARPDRVLGVGRTDAAASRVPRCSPARSSEGARQRSRARSPACAPRGRARRPCPRTSICPRYGSARRTSRFRPRIRCRHRRRRTRATPHRRRTSARRGCRVRCACRSRDGADTAARPAGLGTRSPSVRRRRRRCSRCEGTPRALAAPARGCRRPPLPRAPCVRRPTVS